MIVERTGEKIGDIIHKSIPWEAIHYSRKDCMFCHSGKEKLIGKYKKKNISIKHNDKYVKGRWERMMG